MSDASDFNYSDDEIDDKSHTKIVENVLNINKTRHLKRPVRTEPTSHVSEFNLVKPIAGKLANIQLEKLTRVLKNKKNCVNLKEKFESAKKKARTLPKPLEKPQSEKISRSVAYERNRFLFDRWEAFVTSNRAEAHRVFPVNNVEKLKVQAKEVEKLPQMWTFKSDLEKKLDKLETEEYIIGNVNEENTYPLTLKELKEKRKEAAKMRAHQSFKEAKARRQNKIKSKKFHRILRKEKIKQKLKEFEELQKTDPEQALVKLEEIEKARALERFSLRHKSTGQWAMNKQIRAKYDKESRKVLSQQLQLSRELTQKSKQIESDSDFEEAQGETLSLTNHDNPWIGGLQPNKEVCDFVSGYRKFWSEQKAKSEEQNDLISNTVDEDFKFQLDVDQPINDIVEQQQVVSNQQQEFPDISKKKSKKCVDYNIITKEKQVNVNNMSGDWDVDEFFENIETKIKKKVHNKSKNDSKKVVKLKSKKNLKEKNLKPKKISLDMPIQSKKHVIDEELNETSGVNKKENNSNIENLKNILNGVKDANNKTNGKIKNTIGDIDPTEFMKPKTPIELDSALPDLVLEEDPEQDTQKNIIMEAFEDDDVVQDFTKEKKHEIDKDMSQTIDLNLPGWGSWAGTGIHPRKQKRRRRFIVKMPEVLPRRDDNKGTLIINEKATAKVKLHQVTEIPFPFKSVIDYEASIRAPIGKTFVPELAFRKFTRPAVQTRMGTIIEPVTTSQLMGKPGN
ncbi:hypothetical protein GWI33_021646 [Rhynchophorus ferrugineus]|uniref:U3 small nucleolar RNA-associated protein 14 homolog A n=1 Tax=Rhynchophorus ferrugineus TaxID=354439 RepID=A0A834IR44_RHYFE|nr:hypothetical protein GWI33_021646 [Rhynchophorus ferrugineus]